MEVRDEPSEPIGKGEKETVAFFFVDGGQRARYVLADTRMVPIPFVFPEIGICGGPLHDVGAALREHPLQIVI